MSISEADLNALSAFASLVEEYCALIESLQSPRPPNLYGTLEALLARLHLAILPVEKEMPRKEHRKFKKLGMSYDEWRDIANMIGQATGKESAGLVEEHEGLSSPWQKSRRLNNNQCGGMLLSSHQGG